MDWNKAKEALKKEGYIQMNASNGSFRLIDIGQHSACSLERLSTIQAHNGCILVSRLAELEQFVTEVNPLAYDIIELSERSIFLQLKPEKKLHPSLLAKELFWSFCWLTHSQICKLVQASRNIFFLEEIADESSEFEIFEALLDDYGIIKLEANGLVQVVKN
jgi:hypothetical protein